MKLSRLFSFDWLKSKERKEYLEKSKLFFNIKQENIYKKLIYNNNSITIVMNDNNVISFNCNFDQYNNIRVVDTEENLYKLIRIYTNNNKNDEEIIKVNDFYCFENNPDFKVDYSDNKVYLNPSPLPLPNMIISSFIEIIELMNMYPDYNEGLLEEYESLKMFWYKLSLSPLEICRESVYEYIKANDVKITPLGNIIAYRNIVTYSTFYKDYSLIDITNIISKVKRWKKSLKSYYLFYYIPCNELVLSTIIDGKDVDKYKYIGNLNDINKDIDEGLHIETIYTSQNNQGKYKFKIGDVYQLIDEVPDANVGNCNSNGLHFSSKFGYNYSAFGDTSVCVLINPSKAIYIPINENGKGRTTEMKIACKYNEHDHIDYDLIKQADEEYNEFTINQIHDILKTKSFETVVVNDNVPNITFNNIQDIQNILKNKTVKI